MHVDSDRLSRHQEDRRRRLLRRGWGILVRDWRTWILAIETIVIGSNAGPWAAAAALLVALVLVAAVFEVASRRSAAKERARRRAGEAPSWPAMMQIAEYRLLGRRPKDSLRDDVEVIGRLMSEPRGGLRWIPSSGSEDLLGLRPVVFDHSWTPSLAGLWGIGDRGLLTIRHHDGRVVDLLVRGETDLRQHLVSARPPQTLPTLGA